MLRKKGDNILYLEFIEEEFQAPQTVLIVAMEDWKSSERGPAAVFVNGTVIAKTDDLRLI